MQRYGWQLSSFREDVGLSLALSGDNCFGIEVLDSIIVWRMQGLGHPKTWYPLFRWRGDRVYCPPLLGWVRFVRYSLMEKKIYAAAVITRMTAWACSALLLVWVGKPSWPSVSHIASANPAWMTDQLHQGLYLWKDRKWAEAALCIHVSL